MKNSWVKKTKSSLCRLGRWRFARSGSSPSPVNTTSLPVRCGVWSSAGESKTRRRRNKRKHLISCLVSSLLLREENVSTSATRDVSSLLRQREERHLSSFLLHQVFNLSLSVDNGRYIQDTVSIWHHSWGQRLQKQLFLLLSSIQADEKSMLSLYCGGLAPTKWSTFWFFALTENKRGKLLLLFTLLIQCEHKVKGEEGLKLTHYLTASPGFELLAAGMCLLTPLVSFLWNQNQMFPNVKTLNTVSVKRRSSSWGHAGVLSR